MMTTNPNEPAIYSDVEELPDKTHKAWLHGVGSDGTVGKGEVRSLGTFASREDARRTGETAVAQFTGSDPTAHTEELEAENGRWLTTGELRSYLAQFPDDMPITASKPNGDWFNLVGASNPNATDEPSIVLITQDDFDTRQW